MIANNINGKIETFNSIPKVWNNVFGYDKLDTIRHNADGFYQLADVATSDTTKLGAIIFDDINNIYTYELLDKTDEEMTLFNSNKLAQYKEMINGYFAMMYIRALSSSMNKNSIDLSYLQGIREEYTDKYNVSKGLLTSGVLYDNTLLSIQGEMEDEFTESYLDIVLPTFGLTPTGTHQNKMFQLIVFKYEYGLNSFANFNMFIRRFRTKCNKWVDGLEYNKLDSAFALVDDLPNSLNVSDAGVLFNTFNAI